MARRTRPDDAKGVGTAQELEETVEDKCDRWRAAPGKARRQQRRYPRLLTDQLRREPFEIAENEPC
ncbi:MAG: hypothetical protein AAFU77_11220 [Myxococcota bacterium]